MYSLKVENRSKVSRGRRAGVRGAGRQGLEARERIAEVELRLAEP